MSEEKQPSGKGWDEPDNHCRDEAVKILLFFALVFVLILFIF